MNSKSNKKITILGMDIWNLFAYFIIYSIAGFFVETIFAFVRYGMLIVAQSGSEKGTVLPS